MEEGGSALRNRKQRGGRHLYVKSSERFGRCTFLEVNPQSAICFAANGAFSLVASKSVRRQSSYGEVESSGCSGLEPFDLDVFPVDIVRVAECRHAKRHNRMNFPLNAQFTIEPFAILLQG